MGARALFDPLPALLAVGQFAASGAGDVPQSLMARPAVRRTCEIESTVGYELPKYRNHCCGDGGCTSWILEDFKATRSLVGAAPAWGWMVRRRERRPNGNPSLTGRKGWGPGTVALSSGKCDGSAVIKLRQ